MRRDRSPVRRPRRTDGANAASHREAPLISLDPAADISDFFLFRSYEPGKSDRVVLIMDVNPGEEPSSGPNYYGFDPSVTYSFGIDNDRDGKADDVRFDVRFKNEFRGLTQRPRASAPLHRRRPAARRRRRRRSRATACGRRYQVTMNGRRLHQGLAAGRCRTTSVRARRRTTRRLPRRRASRQLDGGIRVFAGPRDDPFYIDLGAAFDTLNLRRSSGRHPGIDMLAGHNVHTIAIEVPMAMISNGLERDRRLRVHERPRVTIRTARHRRRRAAPPSRCSGSRTRSSTS